MAIGSRAKNDEAIQQSISRALAFAGSLWHNRPDVAKEKCYDMVYEMEQWGVTKVNGCSANSYDFYHPSLPVLAKVQPHIVISFAQVVIEPMVQQHQLWMGLAIDFNGLRPNQTYPCH